MAFWQPDGAFNGLAQGQRPFLGSLLVADRTARTTKCCLRSRNGFLAAGPNTASGTGTPGLMSITNHKDVGDR